MMGGDQTAIEQAQLYADLPAQVAQHQRRTQGLEAISRVGQAIGSSLALDEVLDRALDAILAVMEMEAGEIWLLDTATTEMRLTRHRGLNSEAFWERTRFVLGEGIPGRVAQTGEVIIIPELATDPRFLRRRVVAAGFKTFAAFPLLAKGEVVGCLDVAARQLRSLTEDDVRLLTAIGIAVGMAVANAYLYENVTRLLGEKLGELRQTQAHLIATERLRVMGELAAGVAHDFNNALMGILGQTQLMQLALAQGTLSKDQLSHCLSRQERAVLDAAETARKIREATRPRGAEPFTPVALNEVVTEIVEITRPRWKEEPHARGISITLRTELGDIPPISGRAAELREALTNLLFNAVDAMPEGGRMTITTRRVPGRSTNVGSPDSSRLTPHALPTDMVELTVRDTGIGMSEAVLARLFEPFFTTKGTRGSGLGLSMVRGIVSRYGGTVDVASAPGQGTTVTVRLPAASEAAPVTAPPITSPFPLRSLRVLVIDDIPLVAETLAQILRVLGHEVAIALGGEEGLACFDTDCFDVVITDLGMPGMSGWDVAAAVKARYPALPVILTTGWAEATEEEGRQPGNEVDLVLAKPFTTEQLSRALAQVIGQERGDVCAGVPASDAERMDHAASTRSMSGLLLSGGA